MAMAMAIVMAMAMAMAMPVTDGDGDGDGDGDASGGGDGDGDTWHSNLKCLWRTPNSIALSAARKECPLMNYHWPPDGSGR